MNGGYYYQDESEMDIRHNRRDDFLYKKRKRKGALETNRNFYFGVVMFINVVGIALLVASMISPQYHYVVVTVLLNIITFDIGLWRVHLTTHCGVGLLGFKSTHFSSFCRAAEIALNGKSLTQLEAYACSADALMFNLFPQGCTSMNRVRVAAFLLISCLLLCGVCYMFGTFLFVTFCLVQRSVKIRMAAIMAQFLAAIVLFFGMIMYLLIGGFNIDLRIGLLVLDLSDFDLSTGFFVFLFTTIWTIMTPCAFYMGMPLKLCHDYVKDDEFGEIADAVEDALRLELITADRQHQNHGGGCGGYGYY